MYINSKLKNGFIFWKINKNYSFLSMWKLTLDYAILRCSYVPIKRELFMSMEVPVLVGSPEGWEHPQAHTLRWLPQQNPLIGEPHLKF